MLSRAHVAGLNLTYSAEVIPAGTSIMAQLCSRFEALRSRIGTQELQYGQQHHIECGHPLVRPKEFDMRYNDAFRNQKTL